MSAPRISGGSLLPRLAVRRPVSTVMAYVAVLVVSGVAYVRMPLELLPAGFSPPFLSVWVPYPNSTPTEVEQTIARPIEEILGTVSGIRSVSSTSSAEGCRVFIRFVQDADMDAAYATVRDRMDRVRAELPDDVERIVVRKYSDSDDPILWAALEIPPSLPDPYRLLDATVVQALQRIDGVANVELYGVPQRSVEILIDQQRLKAHRLDMGSLVRRLAADNFGLASGYIIEGDRKLYVRSIARYASPEEIAAVRVHPTGVTLGDVATVRYGEPERRTITRVGGDRGAMIAVYKESTANTVTVGETAKGLLDEVLRSHGPLSRVRAQPLFDQAAMIRDSIEQLKGSLAWGAAFAVGVLFFFLRRVRMTLAVTLAMPFSLLVAVAALYFLGWSLNVVTMMGLMICIGLVVDNSIVVIENIYRRSQAGDDPENAAIGGGSEVSLAITIATLTTVVVFVPLILMNDDVGFAFYMLRMGVPTIVGILASLVVALTLIPLLTVRLTHRRQVAEPRIIRTATRLTCRASGWVLDHRLDALLLFVGLTLSIAVPASELAFSQEAQGNINDILLRLELPRNLTLEEAEALVARIEADLYAHREDWDIRTITARVRPGTADVRLFLRPPQRIPWWRHGYRELAERYLGRPPGKPTRDEVIARIPEALPAYPGVRWQIGWSGDGDDDDTVSVVLYGDDTEQLTAIAARLAPRLRRLPGVVSARTALENGEDELRVVVDRQAADRVGLTVRSVARAVAAALRGVELRELHWGDRETDIRLRLAEADRASLRQLRDLTLVGEGGMLVPLATVARFHPARSLGSISRRDGKTSLAIRVVSTTKDAAGVYEAIDRLMANTPLPAGVSWDKGERYARLQESNRAQRFGLVLAITFVFILMGTLFESFLLPFSIILTLPLALVGVYWTLYLTGTPSDFFAGIGMIVLIGIVVNNAIVLVDLTNRYRARGLPRRQALLAAVEHRFRPIAMTALTTIFGLVPIAAGNAYLVGIPYAGLGRGMIGGLLLHTALSPLVVPLLYALLDDLRQACSGVASRLLSAPATGPWTAARRSGTAGSSPAPPAIP